jgi:hypothetical protein
VIVQRQVQSNRKRGRPAKMAIKGRGPYRVVGKAGKDSYRVQKIPAVANVTSRPSPIRKEAAFRLTRIPDSIIIHKRIDGTDKRWIEWNNKLKPHPLEDNLGFYDLGKYVIAPNDAKHAYEWKKEEDKFEEWWLDHDESDGEDELEDDGDDDSKEKPAKKKQRVKVVGSTDKGIKIVSAPPKT